MTAIEAMAEAAQRARRDEADHVSARDTIARLLADPELGPWLRAQTEAAIAEAPPHNGQRRTDP